MSNLFEPVAERVLLSTRVESKIEEAIRLKKLKPGEKLPSELELCEQFAVSRTAVREALRMLSARGLVSIWKGKGVFVNKLTAASVTTPLSLYLELHKDDFALDVVHARQIIEPPISYWAALNHTNTDAQALLNNLEELREADDDHQTLTALDMNFHLLIAKATKNSITPLLLEPIHLLMPGIKKMVYDEVGSAKEAAIEWHGKVLDAILARDAQAAFDAMKAHLNIAEEHVKFAIERTAKEAAA